MDRKRTTALGIRLAQRPAGVTVNQLATAAGIAASAARYTLNVLHRIGELTRERGQVPAVRSPGAAPWIYRYRWNGDVPGGGLDGR